jgi:predicted metal-dependent enzyme (double-stranded beta helix superfamily)
MTQTLFPITDQAVLPTSVLATIVDGLAVAETLWRPLVRHDPNDRTSARLLATDAYDVWLLGWWPGQKVELHDHGAAAAAYRVVEGTLVDVSAPDDGPIRRTRVGAGALHRVEAGVAHSVEAVNVGLATSLHVYSPPLAEMGFRERGAVRHEPVSWEAPVLAGAVRPIVHPSITSEGIGG